MPGLAAAMLGPAAILAYAVCVVLIGLVGLCLAEIGSRVSNAGGLTRTRPPRSVRSSAASPARCCGAGCVAPSAAVAALLMDTVAKVLPSLAGGASRVGVLLAVYIVVAAVNIRGTRSGARVSLALAVLKIAPLVVLVIAGAFAVQGDSKPALGGSSDGPGYRPDRGAAVLRVHGH